MEVGQYLQQGDVIIKKVAKIPDNATEKGDLVLAEGEKTGHKHFIQDIRNAVLLLVGTAMYLRVIEDAKLFHDEHKEVTIPPGDYLVDIVREFDHFSEEARRVAD